MCPSRMPDFQTYLGGHKRKGITAAIDLEARICGDLEDLTKGRPLLLFLNTRKRNLLDLPACSDANESRLGEMAQAGTSLYAALGRY